MAEQFDMSALEKALAPRGRGKKAAPKKEQKPEAKKRNPDKPLFVPVGKEGEEVNLKDIKEGKAYGLKQDS